jgi:hypothetical protein
MRLPNTEDTPISPSHTLRLYLYVSEGHTFNEKKKEDGRRADGLARLLLEE